MTLSISPAHRLNAVIGQQEKAVAVRCDPGSERESVFEGTFHEAKAWFKKQEPSERQNIEMHLPDRGAKPRAFNAVDMIRLCDLDL